MNRMKRLLAAALTFAATLSLASCGTSNSKDSVGQTPAPPSQTAESQSAGRELSMALSVDPDGLIRSAQQLPVHFRLPIIYTIRFFGSIQMVL